ncbi:Iron-sulfur cluster assembly protein 1 [Spatholobus suberectus]|nr:Iron-sulfur cluster assembly protein 1 [Spatholobus suberectus]
MKLSVPGCPPHLLPLFPNLHHLLYLPTSFMLRTPPTTPPKNAGNRLNAKRLVRMASSLLGVIDHCNNPRYVGSIDKNDLVVGTGLIRAPAYGDIIKLQIKVDEKMRKIVDACFKTSSCGSTIAFSSISNIF